MTRTELIALAQSFGLNLADADTLDRFLADVFDELGLAARPPFIQASIKALTAGTATYAFESNILRLLHAFYAAGYLTPTTESALSAYAQTWPADSGTPKAITQDGEIARTYTVYPNPAANSAPLIPLNGEPFGEDLPANSLVLIFADNPTTGISDIYSLPITFDLLAREFAYPSDHEDQEFAAVSREIADLLYSLVGVR